MECITRLVQGEDGYELYTNRGKIYPKETWKRIMNRKTMPVLAALRAFLWRKRFRFSSSEKVQILSNDGSVL